MPVCHPLVISDVTDSIVCRANNRSSSYRDEACGGGDGDGDGDSVVVNCVV